MKSIFKIVLLMLGLLQISLPVINVITNNDYHILADGKTIILGLLNSTIYFVVVYLLNENDKKNKKIEEIEKRLDNHYISIKNIENANKES